MQTNGFEQWFKMNKNLAAPLTESAQVFTDMCKRITEQNLAVISENCARMSERLKHLTTLRKPEEFINFHKDCVNEDISAMLDLTHKYLKIHMNNLEQLTRLFGSSLENLHDVSTRFTSRAERMEKAERTME